MELSTKLMSGLGGTAVVVALVAVLLPSILHLFGFHPDFDGRHDEHLVTEQNQNSSHETAQWIMAVLDERDS